MRPESLFPLFAPVTGLKGVGPRVATLMQKLDVERVVDLLFLLPTGVVDRRYRPSVEAAEPGTVVTLDVAVLEHRPGRSGKQPYRVFVGDASGVVALVFFHPRRDWLLKTFPPGARRIVSGRLERFGEQLQIAHPDHVADPERDESIPLLEPVYPLTAGLAPRTLRNAVWAALERAPTLPEWLDEALAAQHRFPAWREALQRVHRPDGESDARAARRRLAYDELLANQLAVALVRRQMKRQGGRELKGAGERLKALEAGLPFRLTSAQARVLDEIVADMASPRRMLRLLQGDVGSGKTVVALLAAAAAADAGAQAALMVPTEVLARQHARTLEALAAPAALRVACLTGRDKGKARQAVLDELAAGRVDILVGTHTLFQEGVAFHDLGLAVIDEQHRFGVHQRMMLSGKSKRPADVLVMTATPIPRTLAMTAYGDMDVSRIDERPPGRAAIDTRVLPVDRLDDVVERLRVLLERGERAYWICPLVEDDGEGEVTAAAAEARHRDLSARLGDGIGLVHGRLKAEDKDAALQTFARGETRLLVATTVIEVGVDVPEATVIVIEEAERFGLAQLHQLRGRVGRGKRPGTCLLLYRQPLGETARQRLSVLRETDDGFRIAEEDFRLRGPGDVLGTRQSGLPDFRLADAEGDADLLAIAHDDARLIVETDSELKGRRGAALRTLLYLFERDAAIRYLRSG